MVKQHSEHNKDANYNNYNNTTVDAREKRPFQWEKVLLYLVKIALAATALAFVVQRWKQRNQLSSKERHRLEFSWFAAIWTIIGSTIFLLLGLLRKGKSLHHTIFSTITTLLWIIGGALIHTLAVALECGSHALLNNGQGGALNCHQLKVIEALSWALVAVSLISALVTFLLSRRRRAQRRAGRHREGNY